MGKIIQDDYFLTIENPAFSEIKIKGSTFIGAAFRVTSREKAEGELAVYRKKYYDATHNCFAYNIDQDLFRYSDDGEPSGTAGKPIFNAIEKFGLIQLLLIVTRYFGGTKLGTGGLIRAYGECAEVALKNAKIIRHANFRCLKVRYDFDLINKIQYVVKNFNAKLIDDADEDGMISSISVLPSRYEAMQSELISQTAGKVLIL